MVFIPFEPKHHKSKSKKKDLSVGTDTVPAPTTSKNFKDEVPVGKEKENSVEEGKTLSISELAGLLGLTESAIRKYEKDFDLVVPRDELNRRYYDKDLVKIFEEIVGLKRMGLNRYQIWKHLDSSEYVATQKNKAKTLAIIEKMTVAELCGFLTTEISIIMPDIMKNYSDQLTSNMRDIIMGNLSKSLIENTKNELSVIHKKLNSVDRKLTQIKNLLENGQLKEENQNHSFSAKFKKLFNKDIDPEKKT